MELLVYVEFWEIALMVENVQAGKWYMSMCRRDAKRMPIKLMI
jgi:hypothetical protein